MCVQRGVNGQRGLKPLSLGGPCNSRLSSSLTLSDGGNTICQGWAVGEGEGVNLVSSSSQAPAGLAVHQGRKEPQNWAQDTQGRAAGFQVPSGPIFSPSAVNQSPYWWLCHIQCWAPPISQRILDTLGGSMLLPSWRQQTWTQF